MASWTRQKTLNLAVQAAQLGKHFPGSQTAIRRSQLTWHGKITPSPLSSTYAVRLRYRLRERPKVEVLEPKLQLRGETKPPHLFSGDELCLYLANEWHSSMLLADTIVPWIAEWLLHYEIWLATGEWCGGGVHPNRIPERNADIGETRTTERHQGSRPYNTKSRPK